MQIMFDATTVPPSTGGTTTFLPLDDYPVEITSQEIKPAKDNPNNQMLELTLTVLDGPYKGCNQKTRFNLVNQSEQAVQIARAELSSLCHSIGHLRLAMTEELVGKRCVAEIGPQQGSDKYSEIKRWKNMQLQVNGAGNPAPCIKPATAAATATDTPAPTMPPASAAWGGGNVAQAKPAAASWGQPQTASTGTPASSAPSWAK